MKHTSLLAIVAAVVMSTSAYAADVIGSVKTSGWFFKDSIEIKAFDDPDHPGIACYVTSADRALSWENATDSSIACRKVGAVTETKFESKSALFSENASPFFKYQQVDRFYDAKRNVYVYISYMRKTEGDNASHSISVVPLGN